MIESNQIKKLGDVCDVVIGGTPRRGVEKYWKGGEHLWVSIADLTRSAEVITDTKEKITTIGTHESNVKLIPKGSLIFSFKLSIGKMAFAGHDLYTNEAIAGLIIKDSSVLDQRFLFHFLKQVVFDTVTRAVKGNTLNKDKIKDLNIYVPSLNDQIKVVKIIEKKLIKLEKVVKERKELIADSAKIIHSRLNEIFAENRSSYPVVNFGDLAELVRGPFGGSLTKAMFVDSGYAVYEQGNVIKDVVNNFRYFISAEKFEEMKRFAVREGDILMSCSGTIGKFTYIKDDFKNGIINQALLKITPDNTKISRPYLQLALTDYIANSTGHTKGAAIKNIMSVKDLKQILVPLPDLKTQENIVNEIDKFSEQVTCLQTFQKSQLADLKALEQAYLNEAFCGELSA